MVAFSETHAGIQSSREFDQAKALRENLRDNLQESKGVNRVGRIFFGSVLVISALGLWAVPVVEGDTGMRLIKLLISIVLAGVGVMFFLSIDSAEDLPEIQVDTNKRELRIITRNGGEDGQVEAVHSFDELSEVTIRDRLLTARGENGQLVASVPLRDKAMEAALREALQRTA